MGIKLNIMQTRIKELRIEEYRLIFGTNPKNDKPTLEYGKILSSGKNKGSLKRYWKFWYKSEVERDEKARITFLNLKANIESEKKDKELRIKLRGSLNLDYFIGKCFYSSWGYDQTNVDFVQVIGRTNKMLTIRKIGSLNIEGTEGFMCCRVKPNIGTFKGEERNVLPKVYGENVSFIIGSHSYSEYKKNEDGVYCSWYA